MGWKDRRVPYWWASFIGSHLVDRLVENGAKLRVVDDLSSGKLNNINEHIVQKKVEFVSADLRKPGVAQQVVKDMDVVFHLAADHGGRGYVQLHQAACAGNLALDGMLFLACCDSGVERLVYASSGCVYPNFKQTNPKEELYLTEDMVGPPYDADNMYGWAKLMAEKTLEAYCKEAGMKAASLRYFTVYGEPREGRPRRHGYDSPLLHKTRPLHRLGHRRADSQLDVCG